MGVVGRYLCRFAKEWTLLAITGVDVIVFIITLFYPPENLPATCMRYLTIVVALVTYFIANLRIFAELEPKADIQLALRPEPSRVHYPLPAQAKNRSGEHPYLGKTGLPRLATLELRFDATNSGGEDGELVCEIDIENTELPPLLTLDYETRCNRRFSRVIPGGVERQLIPIGLGFVVTELFREFDFVQALKALSRDSYTIVVNYYTRHSKGTSKQRTIKVKGDFEFFCKALLYDWKQYGFDHLVHMYEFAEQPPSSESS